MFSKSTDAMPFLRDIEKYRITSLHSNACYKMPSQGGFVFLKVYGPKRPAVMYAVRRFLGSVGFRQPIEYASPDDRRTFEAEVLRRWKACGFAVPDIVDNPLKDLRGIPVLSTQFIEGRTLREIVRDPIRSAEERRSMLHDLFSEVAVRHGRAFVERDPMLFHVDANTRNIIFAGNVIYHVDFEMGRLWEPPDLWAAREVLKLLVTLAEDLAPSFRASVVSMFRDCYRHDGVLRSIRSGVVGRPFQSLHRFRNARRKKQNPGRVTLYDLMEYLG